MHDISTNILQAITQSTWLKLNTRKPGQDGLCAQEEEENGVRTVAKHIWDNEKRKIISESRTRAVQLGDQVPLSTAGIESPCYFHPAEYKCYRQETVVSCLYRFLFRIIIHWGGRC